MNAWENTGKILEKNSEHAFVTALSMLYFYVFQNYSF